MPFFCKNERSNFLTCSRNQSNGYYFIKILVIVYDFYNTAYEYMNIINIPQIFRPDIKMPKINCKQFSICTVEWSQNANILCTKCSSNFYETGIAKLKLGQLTINGEIRAGLPCIYNGENGY